MKQIPKKQSNLKHPTEKKFRTFLFQHKITQCMQTNMVAHLIIKIKLKPELELGVLLITLTEVIKVSGTFRK